RLTTNIKVSVKPKIAMMNESSVALTIIGNSPVANDGASVERNKQSKTIMMSSSKLILTA
ncbi:hypothetical protein, partial [Staphylococcus epidermidis]|uniref:hypothetical protein n=1 Tax=Staphylococcus epidermidis TaxID=1282 RepID=UPI00311E01C8